ncbi:hypothetical protein XELAEV_18040276mg [Xenopus laevis]|uniref:G-protein coupled receptors family 3 profile domain-containing protein n=1 Tax=Xenopus laevis TaxID=8355 RepID=A0A974C9E8_XENLA|nr:hypothetical protein XELAEV_18040276mg [Xenopus laevis]
MAKPLWKLIPLKFILVFLILPGSTGQFTKVESDHPCALTSCTNPLLYAVDGDILIGGILQIFLFAVGGMPDFQEAPDHVYCVAPLFRYLTHLLAFMYAIEEINNSTELLPNITLGYHVYDACTSDIMALMSTFSLLSEAENPALNYICKQDQKMVAFVGHLLSSITYTTAEITQLYGYPQISYGALDPVFNDRIHFPSIYRMVPNEYSQFSAIIKLVIHFGWTWVGIIASEDESNLQASEELKKEMWRNGICVDFLKVVWQSDIENKRVWIKSVAPDIIAEYKFKDFLCAFNGSLLISLPKADIPGLSNFISQVIWTDMLKNIFVNYVWVLNGGCSVVFHDNIQNFTCPGEYKIKEYLSQEETMNHHIKYTIYMSVYALAHALDMMQLPTDFLKLSPKKNIGQMRIKLNYYLKNIHMKMASEEDIFFTKDGNIPGKFDILNWVIYGNGTIKKIHVGQFFPITDHLVIHEEAITWSPYFQKTPASFCTELCTPGHRRAHQTGRPSCCFDCVPCSEGEISNSSDLETCVKCPDDHWSNPTRDWCIKRAIDFLSYEDRLGYILAGCASVFIVSTAVVFLVFIKYRRTPIVRANNENTSYILLTALLMSFLCTFMFIGHPTKVTCLLRQATFVCVFSVAISSILGKTMTVLVAFESAKVANKFRRWGRIDISMGVVFICSFVEVLICIIWLTFSPPYVESDIKTIPGKIILQCNEGSIISFYLAVSYIGVLSLCSFAVAFIARKLPDRFNEAQHITFSMLVFCSVWGSFIPTYLSSKGKYMIVVEIFAIQASAAGLLICIFTPKCYTILLKPELNIKGNLTFKIRPKK